MKVVVIFGGGPLPAEPEYAVTAPGSRTWQMLRTAALGMDDPADCQLVVLGLEGETRPPLDFPVPGHHGREIRVRYLPLSYNDYLLAGQQGQTSHGPLPEVVHCVVGTGSVQPYSTAAAFARMRQAPLWVDVFGDPLAEIQTQADLHPEQLQQNDQKAMHVWKLLLDGLLAGDRFSALSSRQRYALLGQLGAAGRLNRYTTDENLVTSIPYGIFPGEAPEPPKPRSGGAVTVMWSGSFNTWMDVDALLEGFLAAAAKTTRLRMMVVGGRIAGYNDASYDKFVAGVRAAGAEGIVQLLDWQPLARMKELYAQADIGLSIDRYTYEAVLGSRTRIINFLAAGLPVLSTVVTELTEDLADTGYVLPFKLNDAADFSRALTDLVDRAEEVRWLGIGGRSHVLEHYDAAKLGQQFAAWIREPVCSQDHLPGSEANQLVEHWKQVRQELR